MPRSRGHSGYKPTHQIIHSGVTYVTRPSGTTIQKNSIAVSGVTIAGSNLQSSYGYPVHASTAGVKVVSGVTKRGGASAYFTAAGLGLSTITNMIVTGSSGPTAHGISMIMPAPAATECTVFYFSCLAPLVTRTYGVSLNYFAIGT